VKFNFQEKNAKIYLGTQDDQKERKNEQKTSS
jgi:hypothetical protein